jgi:hypothetical protein
MRPIHLALALLASAPLAAGAKSWQGVNPGATTAAEVSARFGPPSTQGKLGGRAAYVYKDDAAIGATRQAQFFARDDGVIVEIVVFPSARIDGESVEGTYGKPARKAFTEDLRPVWYYPAAGITVFFGKGGQVDSLSFKAADGAARGDRSAAAPPRHDEAPATPRPPPPAGAR